jgi:hypothetical protein
MDRYLVACHAAERIVNEVESAGFDLADARAIIDGSWGMIGSINYAYGASRLVLWDEDYCDYVIKIALNPCYEKYCQQEVAIYESAVKEGVADSFAWCACYQEPTSDVPGIYVMEYLDCNEDEVYDDAWLFGYKEYCSSRGLDSSNYDNADEYNDWNEGEDADMVLDLLESDMSSEYKRAFEVFMRKWEITDIHQANISSSYPHKIVDYAGWGW